MPENNVTVGFIGLGTMGGRMAANVQKAGPYLSRSYHFHIGS